MTGEPMAELPSEQAARHADEARSALRSRDWAALAAAVQRLEESIGNAADDAWGDVEAALWRSRAATSQRAGKATAQAAQPGASDEQLATAEKATLALLNLVASAIKMSEDSDDA